MDLTVKRFAVPAALGALGVSAGALALYLLIAWGSRSSARSGIDGTQAAITWIALAIPVALVIAAHVVYARILFRYAKEE